MGLEYRCNLLSPIQFADGYHALAYLGRMMGIVCQENGLIVFQPEVETAVHSAEACHALLDFFVGGTAEMGECHGGNSSERSHTPLYLFRCHAADLRQGHSRYPVLDINAYRNSQLHILDMP